MSVYVRGWRITCMVLQLLGQLKPLAEMAHQEETIVFDNSVICMQKCYNRNIIIWVYR